MSPIADNLRAVRRRIDHAAQACGRAPGEVALLAVSKTFPAQAVREAHGAGQRAFGESYVQEAVDKLAALEDLRAGTEWHFIGPLQSNKARQVAAHFDWIHSIDRLKIAQRLSDLRPPGMADLQLCMQVNIDDQPTKSGVAPAEALGLAREIAALPRVRLRGLMCIPAPQQDPVRQQAVFASLAALMRDLNREGFALDTLSMGMSDDLEAAVAAGASIVRVGTAIFGARDYSS
ncbi:YggS family pyridoxal phosphate-dependent enzyme [Pigmentiphaga sp. GD03639]|jgi:pyridoxal phosphate enzyme (YggS family)|uniref:YggS family pyridoxal phosphate-dependent enzyme n=1 Tax=Pigmentiphaga sp. GD03639 TaxID=2975354 RepID=UPI00244D16DF|nr:YggS family pyridoxal phosphate-dependent enzyme [Pigmentiphaga sp. GD03639]MDH2234724.1 YggS family pyridoxal phosphate-dependent enzyme [Pigmentiphaga sp. GD03639]